MNARFSGLCAILTGVIILTFVFIVDGSVHVPEGVQNIVPAKELIHNVVPTYVFYICTLTSCILIYVGALLVATNCFRTSFRIFSPSHYFRFKMDLIDRDEEVK